MECGRCLAFKNSHKGQTILRSAARNRTLWIALLLLVAFVPVGLVVRRWAMERALVRALSGAHYVTARLPKLVPTDKEEEFFPFFLAEPQVGPPLNDAEQKVAPQPGMASRRAHRAPPFGPPPESTRARAEQVLSWAQHRVIPQGRARGAEYGLPAGIELSAVAALGIGLLDGDRLLSVNGVPVQQRGQVVAAVLAARARQETIIVARLVRRTHQGFKEFSVTVEQPYLPGVSPQAPQPEATAPPGPAFQP